MFCLRCIKLYRFIVYILTTVLVYLLHCWSLPSLAVYVCYMENI